MIKTAKRYQPWDYSFMLNIFNSIAEWNEVYYDKYGNFEGSPFVVRDMRLIQKLSNIISGKIEIVSCENLNQDTKLLVQINFRNSERFFPNLGIVELSKFSQELYLRKAQNLLGKLISYRITKWCN